MPLAPFAPLAPLAPCEIHRDPFAAETAWFDAPRRSSRPPRLPVPSQMPPSPPIDDPVADPWFR